MLQDDFQAMGDPYLKKTPVREPRNLAGTGIVVSGATFTFDIACMGKIPFLPHLSILISFTEASCNRHLHS